jgi:hypothetical protein
MYFLALTFKETDKEPAKASMKVFMFLGKYSSKPFPMSSLLLPI